MNFLAHLHLAHLADSSLPGNLLADFVRGNPQADYPADIVDGIFMHRRIDVMTDNLPEVKAARDWFRPQTRRVAPITLDVMWDHFLSHHWARISPDMPLNEFCPLCPGTGHAGITRFAAALRESQCLFVVGALA
ncbi:acyl carrier protein phosphodiesterase [Raoultella ornithinolytica]|nr:acyl carrier protein phosphodiesterase [Raoultella ornithinolytica]